MLMNFLLWNFRKRKKKRNKESNIYKLFGINFRVFFSFWEFLFFFGTEYSEKIYFIFGGLRNCYFGEMEMEMEI